MNVTKVRKDFPVLRRRVHGKPLVYLDNAATTQKPRQVIDALVNYYSNYNANVHRGIHVLSEEATAAYEGARAKVAKLINARSPKEIIFTRNTSESLNLLMYSLGPNIFSEKSVVVSRMEHHSNLVPWQQLTKRNGSSLKFIELHRDGTLNFEGLPKNTALVSVTQASNVLGTINDVTKITKEARAIGAISVIDGAQSVPHMPVDVQKLGCDFLAFSAHKMLGPTGVGVLYGREEVLSQMEPFLYGGDMIKEVSYDEAKWNDLPWKFEAGTPNIADVIAFGAAIDYLNKVGLANVRKHEIALTKYALKRMSELKGVDIYGPLNASKRGGVVAFNIQGMHSHDIASILDADGVAIRSGHHCAMPLMNWLGIPTAARASFYLYNTEKEVDTLIRSIERAKKVFKL